MPPVILCVEKKNNHCDGNSAIMFLVIKRSKCLFHKIQEVQSMEKKTKIVFHHAEIITINVFVFISRLFLKEVFYISKKERISVFRNRTNHQQPWAPGSNPGWWRRAKATEAGKPGSNPALLLTVGYDLGSVTEPLSFLIYKIESSPSL